jgi:acyl-CoA synthetase (AMP-forming)/AMP-acid ligase II
VLTVPAFKGVPFDAGTRAAVEARGARLWLLGAAAAAAAAAAADPGRQAFEPVEATEADRQRLATRLHEEPVVASDIATLCWTSGTEGVPKGVPRSHDHWLAISNAHFEGAGIRPGEVLLNPFPLVNMAAIGGCFMSWLRSAGTLVLHHPLDLAVYLEQIARERPNYTIAPPAVLNMLIQDESLLARTDLSSLRCIGSGSAPLDPGMIRGFHDRFGIEIVNVFGSNEGMTLLSAAADAPEPEMRARFFPRFGRPEVQWARKSASAIETRLIDPDTGAEVLEPGRPAEMQIRGPTVFDGYYRAPQQTAESFTADGYFRTGDLFEIGTDPRYYRYVGRLKQLIVRGGVKIAPDDIEGVLPLHPGIAEAAVVAYPDPLLGERICAVVVRRPGAGPVTLASMQDHLRALGLATFKWPERVREVAALPRNAVGKVVRSELAGLAVTPD